MNRTLFSTRRLSAIHVLLLCCSLCSGLLLSPSTVSALQSHGGLEGLISHQIGHLLFFAAMLILLYWVKKNRLRRPGWLEFTTFLYIALLWNILTFSGHWLGEKVAAEQFDRHGAHLLSFQADTLSDLVFYITRLDHLLLVPAIFMLLLAIRKWGQNQ